MQMNWVKIADKVPITPLTSPKDVLDFIHGHPGLIETVVIILTWLNRRCSATAGSQVLGAILRRN